MIYAKEKGIIALLIVKDDQNKKKTIHTIITLFTNPSKFGLQLTFAKAIAKIFELA